MARESEASGPQLSHVRGDASTPLLETTIGRVFDDSAERFAERTAVVFPHQSIRWSFAELRRETDRLAAGLLALGLARGDRLGVCAQNRVEWVVTQYAAAKLGLVLVNLNPAYQKSEIAFALSKVACKALVTASRFKNTDYLAILRAIAPELNGCPPGTLESAALPALRAVIQLGNEDERGVLSYRDVLERGGGAERSALAGIGAALRPDDTINIQFTSGSTGAPKATMLTHRNLVNVAYFTGRSFGVTERDAVCVPVPLFHVFGMSTGSLLSMLYGAKAVYPAEVFDPRATLAAVEAEKCTVLYGVPTMFVAELALPDFRTFDLTSLRTGISGGAAAPMHLMRQVMTDLHMPEVLIGYGMTETSSTIMITSTDDTIERRVETVGRAVAHVEVRVVGPDGHVLPRGETGEIQVRGYSLMQGYWGDPEKSAAAIGEDGWLRTGDLGVIDGDGYGRVVGRLKELIIRGGENISPVEIEAFLHGHPDIENAYVVGVPDATYGEELCACVKLKEGKALSPEAVRDFCRGQIAHFKIPRHVRFVDSFPLTANGKVQKYMLAAQSVTALGLGPAAAPGAPAQR